MLIISFQNKHIDDIGNRFGTLTKDSKRLEDVLIGETLYRRYEVPNTTEADRLAIALLNTEFRYIDRQEAVLLSFREDNHLDEDIFVDYLYLRNDFGAYDEYLDGELFETMMDTLGVPHHLRGFMRDGNEIE
jgi:hypothetical protein